MRILECGITFKFLLTIYQWIDKNAYDLWINNKINLAYDPNNPDEYVFGGFKQF
jgi:hypothetical protein